jgi:hypothetical protein
MDAEEVLQQQAAVRMQIDKYALNVTVLACMSSVCEPEPGSRCC